MALRSTGAGTPAKPSDVPAGWQVLSPYTFCFSTADGRYSLLVWQPLGARAAGACWRWRVARNSDLPGVAVRRGTDRDVGRAAGAAIEALQSLHKGETGDLFGHDLAAAS